MSATNTTHYNRNGGLKLLKTSLDKATYEEIKRRLTVEPFNNSAYSGAKLDSSFMVYGEDEYYLTIPRFFFQSNPDLSIPNLDSVKPIPLANTSTSLMFKGSLRGEQKQMVEPMIDACRRGGGGILSVPCGKGKCLDPSTPVLKYDGEVVLAEDVKEGDVLIGDDLLPRNVLSTIRGEEDMWLVKQSYGLPYRVNSSHILTLSINGKLVDMNVREYAELPQDIRKQYVGVRTNFHLHKTYRTTTKIRGAYALGLWYRFLLKRRPYNYVKIPILTIFSPKESKLKFLKGVFGDFDVLCLASIHSFTFNYLQALIGSMGMTLKKVCVNDTTCSTILLRFGRTVRLETDLTVVRSYKSEYCGFCIDGNRRFLLGDGTVTHNTVMALDIACKLNAKTLVVVHQEHLLNQWCERIKQFTNARIGFIQRDTVDVDDKDIVIGMLQSIAMRNYPIEIFQNFNLVIVDECHHVAAEVFSRALPKIVTPYVIGLSATPRRKDGLTKVFKWYLGDIVYECKRDADDSVVVKIYDYESEDPKYTKQKKIWVKGKTQINLSGMITQIAKHQHRTEFIVKKLEPYLVDDRYCLILTERKEHMVHLHDALLPILKSRGEKTIGYYCGGMKKKELEASLECDVIVATYHMAAEAFDCAKLNTLVLATPKTDIEQSVGRILRRNHESTPPVILDIRDKPHASFVRQCTKRQTYYRKCGYDVFENDVRKHKKKLGSNKLPVKASSTTSTCMV